MGCLVARDGNAMVNRLDGDRTRVSPSLDFIVGIPLGAGSLERNGVFCRSSNWSGAGPYHFLLHCSQTKHPKRRCLPPSIHPLGPCQCHLQIPWTLSGAGANADIQPGQPAQPTSPAQPMMLLISQKLFFFVFYLSWILRSEME